jgi:hypothetical protein
MDQYKVLLRFDPADLEAKRRWLTDTVLLHAIYGGVVKLAARFYEACPTCLNITLTPLTEDQPELFVKAFGEANNDDTPQAEADHVVFYLTGAGSRMLSACFNLRAAMCTDGGNSTIWMPAYGRGFSESELPITPYLVSHELLHIFSWRTGGIYNPQQNLYQLVNVDLPIDIDYRVISQIIYPFYTPSLIIGRFDEGVPIQGINNWGGDEESSVEMLNIWVWTSSQPFYLGYRTALNSNPPNNIALAVVAVIESGLSTWIGFAGEPDNCNSQEASEC